jgi:hypothetical protein
MALCPWFYHFHRSILPAIKLYFGEEEGVDPATGRLLSSLPPFFSSAHTSESSLPATSHSPRLRVVAARCQPQPTPPSRCYPLPTTIDTSESSLPATHYRHASELPLPAAAHASESAVFRMAAPASPGIASVDGIELVSVHGTETVSVSPSLAEVREYSQTQVAAFLQRDGVFSGMIPEVLEEFMRANNAGRHLVDRCHDPAFLTPHVGPAIADDIAQLVRAAGKSWPSSAAVGRPASTDWPGVRSIPWSSVPVFTSSIDLCSPASSCISRRRSRRSKDAEIN